jgi:acyl dehydratase
MPKIDDTRGCYFEDLEVGYKVTSPGRTITETDVVMFAGLSGDYNQLHTDTEYAKSTMYGERVAHGLLGLAVVSGLVLRMGFGEGTIQAFTGLDWKFRGPIRLGDTIHTTFEVQKKRAMPRMGGGFITFAVTVLNQRQETVQKGTWTVLVKSRP